MTRIIPGRESRQRAPSRDPRSVSYLLINTPLTDPTQPYHSIPYLVGAARAAGFTGYRCVDANIDALNYVARPDNVSRLLSKARDVRASIEKSPAVTRGDEMRYQVALAATDLAPDFASLAIDVFRDPDRFYHYPTYRQAVMALQRWLQLLCLDGAPAVLRDFAVRTKGAVNLASYIDLSQPSVLDAVTASIDSYLRGPYAAVLGERPWELIGFSVNYVSQLPFALRLARQARAACPEAVIVFGGTEVCDVVRFASKTADFWALFADADVIVPGEGETPLREILTAVCDGRAPAGIAGSLHRTEQQRRPQINYENVASLPAPAYDVWDWSAYWTPEPVVLYSPTRGCYWNKCTFCDYGLNTDGPTSPSRDRPVGKVIEDLAAVAAIGRTVYFAVDAMSPRYLRELCQAMAAAPERFRWSAELRLERTFPERGVAELLARAGCVCVSFGYESGAQRILDLIDKGVRITDVSAILHDLAAHGIGAQMMGFTGFPTETAAEAEQTYRFLIEHKDVWSLAGIGTFDLTPGSIVARQPDRFGIGLIPNPPTEDIERLLPWRDLAAGTEHWPGGAGNRIAPELATAIARSVDDRPFVGGIDSGHTMLYFAEYGRGLLPGDPRGKPIIELAPVARCQIPFGNLEQFTTVQELEEHYDALQRHGGASFAAMAQWLGQPGRAERGESTALILPAGTSVALPNGIGAIDPLRELFMLTAQTRGAT